MKKRMKQGKFKSTTRPNTTDDRGSVQVCVILKGSNGGHIRGNITKYMTLKDAKVSEVFGAIENALLE